MVIIKKTRNYFESNAQNKRGKGYNVGTKKTSNIKIVERAKIDINTNT